MARTKLSNILHLQDSFKRVLREERAGRKLLPDILCFTDQQVNQNDILDRIAKSLDSKSYSPLPFLTMAIPRDNYCTRPGTAFPLQDLVTYDAFANYIGRSANPKLDARVFSYRFNKSGELIPGVRQWTTFENSSFKAFDWSDPDACILQSDITSYFANINLNILQDTILTILNGSSRTNERIVDALLNSLLRPWAHGAIQSNLGIPQGVDASSILGNLFLHHLDAKISKIPGTKYFRFVDDIRIITPGKVTAKTTLMQLIDTLAEIGLDPNSSKTRILDSEEARALRDPRTEDMALVDKLIRSKNRANVSIAQPILMRIFHEAFNDHLLYRRHLSFAINRFVILHNLLKGNRRFVASTSKVLLSHLEQRPGCTREFSRFFRYFPSLTSGVQLVDFLQSADNIYAWQEMWILDSLLRFQRITPSALRAFEETAKDVTKHEMCRSKAILLAGKFGDHHVRHELATMYNDGLDLVIKRAIVFACQDLAQAERNTFYDMVAKNREMRHIVKYVTSLRKPKYCEEEYWTPLDIPDWGTY